MDTSAVLFSLSTFAVLSIILFYISIALKELKSGHGKLTISLFLKELGGRLEKEPAGYSSSVDVSKESELPDGWFSHEQIFNLEKRAIFSKVR